MQAVLHKRFGEPADALEVGEVDVPAIGGPDDVLVKVIATGIAKGDWLITRGLPYIARPSYGVRTPKEPVAGLQFAGRVKAVGRAVREFLPGDTVFGVHNGTLAEYVAAPASALAHKPAGVSFAQAAAAPIPGLAALQAIRAARVERGMSVLVIGASGAVGTFAVQFANAFGARVTGVGGPSSESLVRRVGADDFVDYTREEIGERGVRYDVIIDIAGNRAVSHLRSVLTPTGALVIVGGTGGNWTMGFGRTVGAMLLAPFVRHRIVGLISRPNPDDLRTLADFMKSGRVVPVVGATYTLREAPRAVDLAGDGRGRGTIAVTVRGHEA